MLAAGNLDHRAGRDVAAACPRLGEQLLVNGLAFTYGEESLALACSRCDSEFEQVVPSPMCVVHVECPYCGVRGALDPERYAAIATRLRPPLEAPDADALDGTVARLVAGWGDGLGLGAAVAAQHLAPTVLDGVLAARAGETGPDASRALLLRAEALARAGDLVAAEEAYRTAVALAPAAIEARLGLATILLAVGRAEDAEPEFRAAAAAGLPVAIAGVAMCLGARGAVADARAILEEALAEGEEPILRDLLLALPGDDRRLGPAVEAAGLRFTYGEEVLALRCTACSAAWNQHVPSAMCEVALACPGCGAAARLHPETYARVVARWQPAVAVGAADALDASAARLVAAWHRDGALAPALRLADADAGACAEQELMPIVLDAVLAVMSGAA